MNPQIITESVHVNQSAKNDTDSINIRSLDNMPELVHRDREPYSKDTIPNTEGATPPIVPVLPGISLYEGATQNSAPNTNVSEGVAPSPLDPTDISSTLDSSLLIPQLLNSNDTTLRRPQRTRKNHN